MSNHGMSSTAVDDRGVPRAAGKILFLGMGSDYTYDCDINFYEPLKQLGEVINYNFYRRTKEIGAVAMNREVLSLAEREQPRYVFLHTFRHEVFKSTLAELAARGIPTVLWFSDDHTRFDNYSRHFGRVASYSVTTDHLSVAKYEALGIPVILSQWASNPDYYRPVPVARDIDVSFVGARTAAREAFVKGLQEQGIAVEAFGSDWPNGKISFDEMIRVFSRSRINLNSSFFWTGTHPQIKGRVFEIPMSGGLLMTDYATGLEQYFDVGREILCYRSVPEAADLVKYYLAHEDERAHIAEAGYRRSLRDHTWQVRLRTLFDEVQRREAARLRDGTRRAVPPPAPNVPVATSSNPRVLEVFVAAGQQITLRSAVAAGGAAVSVEDLGEGLAPVVAGEREVEVASPPHGSQQMPFADGSHSVILAPGPLDWLAESEAHGFLAECARVLAPDGVLFGTAKRWYATDRQSMDAHRHRGYRASRTPAQITKELRQQFAAVVTIEVPRPMGPMGPFVIFIAAHQRARLEQADVRRVCDAARAAAAPFAAAAYEASLLWSAMLHARGMRGPALRYALRALRQRTSSPASWKALARALAGRTVWQHVRTPPADTQVA